MRSLIHHQGLQISYTYLQSRLFTETAGTFSSYLWIFRVSPKCDPFVPWFLNNFYQCAVCANSLQSCPTLCTPMNCTPLGTFVHGILQARMLEWVAMPSSRGSSQSRDRTHISYVSWIGRQVLYHKHHLGSPLLLIQIYYLGFFPSRNMIYAHLGPVQWILKKHVMMSNLKPPCIAGPLSKGEFPINSGNFLKIRMQFCMPLVLIFLTLTHNLFIHLED